MAASVAHYSALTGMVYLGNLLVGTGALALPRSFQDAGYALGLFTMLVLAFVSYMNVTFVIEAMSVASACLSEEKKLQDEKPSSSSSTTTTTTTTVAVIASGRSEQQRVRQQESLDESSDLGKEEKFDLKENMELGRMACLVLGRWGWLFFYACMGVYLFGDLIIYGVVVPKALMNAVCAYPDNQSLINVSSSWACRSGGDVEFSRGAVYRILVVVFGLVLGPFVFFGIGRTKYFQFVASFLRWASFLVMIGWAVQRLVAGTADGHPEPARPSQFTSLFGTTVYSFMCHHSLPAILTPIEQKARLQIRVGIVYLVVFSFYLTMAVTAVLAFGRLHDVYVLDFFQLSAGSTWDADHWTLVTLLKYFLLLFPVFTISSNYPIIGITLRNNVNMLLFGPDDGFASTVSTQCLVVSDQKEQSTWCGKWGWTLRRVVVPFLVVLLPLCISLVTDDVEALIAATGSYAGVGIQYVTPTWLVWHLRSSRADLVDQMPSNLASPFRHKAWLIFSFLWALSSVLIVTIHHILAHFYS
ncbi:Transmembrane protein [Trichinella pseudospiralis]|uniref:Transmembrane protein n=1 Tax=Trichinella pseudospiralis TaxID=6337 RepID=A0A0V0YIM2_TRIPS|nr:Transmembrane protein [Trichinella pseudospiralis]